MSPVRATTPLATELAAWAASLEPAEDDLALAQRSLRDTVAVTLAAREDPLRELTRTLPEAGRWAALAHVLDFDDLHLPSTAHLSAVCAPVAIATGGGARAYLAGAGVMARLGTGLGWRHYEAGWHATATAGAPAAAAAAGVAFGLDAERIAAAIALAVPGAGGVQRAFGTAAKSLQVAHAAECGMRAAELARAGASADPAALEEWMRLVGGDSDAVSLEGPAIPGGLAVKPFPCCYALQRPISAVVGLGPLDAGAVRGVSIRTPRSSLAPLIHHRPTTGLEGKFSLEYGVAAAILDGAPGLESFTDVAVVRPDAARLVALVEVESQAEGEGLLAGEVEVEVALDDGRALQGALDLPPGAPGRPLTEDELEAKLRACAPDAVDELRELTWQTAAAYLRERV
jgi:2-methylcitrate dehydratase PrpD